MASTESNPIARDGRQRDPLCADRFGFACNGSGHGFGDCVAPCTGPWTLTIEAVAELLDRLLARLARSRLKPFVRCARTVA